MGFLARAARPSLAFAVWAVVLVLLILCLITYLLHAGSLLAFPYELDPGEGFDLAGAVVLLAGGQLYGDFSRFPFFASNYPPVYPLVVAPLVGVLGPSVAVGRIVSVAAGLGTGLVVMYAVRVPRPTFLPAVAAGLAWLASAYVLHVTPLARVTSLMLFLGVAGLYCLERGVELRGARALWIGLGVGLLVAGIYTKPVGLDAAVAGAAYLLARRPAGWAGALSALAFGSLGLHLLLEWASAGRYSQAVIVSNAYPWDWGQAGSFWRNFVETHGLLAALGGVGLVGHILTRWMSVWTFYLAAGLVTAATAGRWGAGESYFLPIVVASCVLAGRALAWLPRASRAREVAASALGLYALLGSAGPWPLSGLIPSWDRGFQAHALGHAPGGQDLQTGRRIQRFAESAGGPVLSEAAGFVLRSGEQVVGNPMLIRGLHSHGLYDVSQLVRALETQSIKAVILLGEWYPSEVLQAIGANYDRVERVAVAGSTYILFKPRAG